MQPFSHPIDVIDSIAGRISSVEELHSLAGQDVWLFHTAAERKYDGSSYEVFSDSVITTWRVGPIFTRRMWATSSDVNKYMTITKLDEASRYDLSSSQPGYHVYVLNGHQIGDGREFISYLNLEQYNLFPNDRVLLWFANAIFRTKKGAETARLAVSLIGEPPTFKRCPTDPKEAGIRLVSARSVNSSIRRWKKLTSL